MDRNIWTRYRKTFWIVGLLGIFLFFSTALAEETGVASIDDEEMIWETVPLIFNGGFETDESKGETKDIASIWKCAPEAEENKITRDTEKYLSGKGSLRVEGKGAVTVSTVPISIPSGMVSITGNISYCGSFQSRVFVEWFKGSEVVGKNELRMVETAGSEWKRFVLSETVVPSGADSIRFCLSTEFNPSGTVWWDEANFNGVVEQSKTVDVFVNQVGYDLLYPKVCVVGMNFKPEKMTAYLLGASDREVMEIHFEEPVRIIGAHKSDWGKWFYRGDFTEYNEEGSYRIVVIIGDKRYYSPAFLIGKDLLWEKTIPQVLEGIRLHRCGTKVEGIHEPCHTDDTLENIPLIGGWHDGETYSKTKSAVCLNLLVESYTLCMWRLLKNPELATKMREEIEWGARYVANRIKEDGGLIGNIISKNTGEIKKPELETDNQQNTGDERPVEPVVSDEEAVVSALGNIAYLFSRLNLDNPYMPRTETLVRTMVSQGKKTAGLFNAMVYLEEMKNTGDYISAIRSSVPTYLLPVSEAIPRYDSLTYENKAFDLVQALKEAIQRYAEQANKNPFGICPIKWTPEMDYLGITTITDGQVKGNNLYLLQVAQIAGKAFRFIPEDMTKKLFFDQINWILGLNPFGVCFIEGLGTKNMRSYAHPYVQCGVDSRKLIGVIPFGVRAISQNSDIPFLDMDASSSTDVNSAGVSIETMAMYINALSHFYRVRVHPETPMRPTSF